MKKEAVRIIFFSLIAFVLFFSVVNAFSISNIGKPSNFIEKEYPLGGTITGWINISLNNEPSNSTFKTSFGSSVELGELISQNEITGSLSYSCSPVDCNSAYSASNEVLEKTFALGKRDSHIVGLKFDGDGLSDIRDFSMTVESDASESTSKQLYIDVLDDGSFEWQSNAGSGIYYGENDGCYDSSTTESYITTAMFCEKIKVPISPSVEIGAYLINPANPTATFVMTIDNENGNEGSCEITPTTGGRVGCIPQNFQIDEEEDYYICINAETSADGGKYKINYETDGNVCGYAASKNYKKDFRIFASPEKFAQVGTFELKSESGEIESAMEGYIIDRYAGDCTDGCVIPIRITSGKDTDQTIILGKVEITYSAEGLPFFKNEQEGYFEIYEVSEKPAKISSGFMQLHLDDANFLTPSKFGKQNFSLNLSDVPVFSKEIEIQKVPQIASLIPTIAIAAIPIEFKVNVETFGSEAKIVNYEWVFGNASLFDEITGMLSGETTIGNKINHTFQQIGDTTATIYITDSNGFTSSKTFNIIVATPAESVKMLMTKNTNSLNNLKTAIDGLLPFEQKSVKEAIDFAGAESSMSNLQQRTATAVSDNDYVSIMSELIGINLPESIDITKSIDSIPFYPSPESINLNILQKIGGGDYIGDEAAYTDAIVAWEFSNTQSKLSSKEFTANYENSDDEMLNTFELSINDDPSIQGSYLIMPKFENLKFDKDYSEKEEEGNIYIQLNGGEKIVFSTTENIEFTDLPAFISPALGELKIQTPIINTQEISKQTLIILAVLLVAFIGFIVYLVMQQWYKRKYENYLFKNKNDLYNIVSYIHNMKKQGVDDKKVSAGLRKSGWNSEQVTYIIRKYYGKRTGMFEIPINNIINLFRRKGDFGNYPNR